MVVLAGGYATRLRPATEKIPKALIEVAGEPFLAHQLRLLAARGIQRVVLSVGYRGEMIEEFAGDGSRFGLETVCVHDGPEPLGTAGAIRLALPFLGGAFFTLYGDSYLNCDFEAVAEAFFDSRKTGLMTVFRNDGLFDQSNIVYRDGKILVYDKNAHAPDMRYIDYGLGVFRASAFDPIPHGRPFDLSAIYQRLLAARDLAAFEVFERFYEIGTPEGLAGTEAYLRDQTAGPL